MPPEHKHTPAVVLTGCLRITAAVTFSYVRSALKGDHKYTFLFFRRRRRCAANAAKIDRHA
jgi:hypothetical protein